MRNLALHWKIIIGMVLGVIIGFIAAQIPGINYTNDTGKLSIDLSTDTEATYAIPFEVREKANPDNKQVFTAIINGDNSESAYNHISIDKNMGRISFDLLKEADQSKYAFTAIKDPVKWEEIIRSRRDSLPYIQTGDRVEIVTKTKHPFPVSIRQAPNQSFITNWVKPFGTIFINLLKLIAVPLIIVSLIKGISDLQDISKLSLLGGRTIGIYMVTTVVAVILGLVLVNVVQPGSLIKPETMESLRTEYQGAAQDKISLATQQMSDGPLQPLVDIFPSNLFQALTNNKMMLQVIFFAIFFGIGMILIDQKKVKPVKDFFDALNDVILKLIDLIMLYAPYGVMALMAALVAESPSTDILVGLLGYSLTLLAGLAILTIVFYPTLVRIFTGRSYSFFFKGIAPAQLVAFSTSSSAATLPVTMERTEEHLGVDKEVTSFVLPIGATVNMDGTSCYQAVAAVFIAQAFGMDLTIGQQLGIIITATLASIGSAAVPSAGLVMLVIVLGAAGIPEAGLALIIAVDRPLDMCRTIVNVTGDATVSMLVGKSVGKLGEPNVKNWDDHYKPAT